MFSSPQLLLSRLKSGIEAMLPTITQLCPIRGELRRVPAGSISVAEIQREADVSRIGVPS